MDTASIRKPAEAPRMRVMRPARSRLPRWVVRLSWVFWPLLGWTVPSGENHPTPPPWRNTHSGRTSSAGVPSLVAMVKVLSPETAQG